MIEVKVDKYYLELLRKECSQSNRWELAKSIFLTGYELKAYEKANAGYLKYALQTRRIKEYKEKINVMKEVYNRRFKEKL